MSRKRRRARQSVAEDIVEITSQLPWWGGVALALASWLLMKGLRVAAGPGHDLSAGWVIMSVFAMVGQYVLPVLFVFGAVASFFQSEKRKRVARKEALVRSSNESEATKAVPGPGRDLYDLWRSASSSEKHLPRPDTWSLELLRAIDWKRFEELCAEYFRLCGFRAITQSHGADGGIDIRLCAASDPTKVVNLVQCKRWNDRPVGLRELREFLGVMTANKLQRGTFVTSSTFNAEGAAFAASNKIHMLDGEEFLKRILDRPVADQQRLLEVATEGDYLTPTCPSCGIKLVKRQNGKDGSEFWSCSTFPRCRYKLPA